MPAGNLQRGGTVPAGNLQRGGTCHRTGVDAKSSCRSDVGMMSLRRRVPGRLTLNIIYISKGFAEPRH